MVRPSEELVEGAGGRTAVQYEPNDVRAHNLRVVQLRHGAEGMISALMFRRIMRSAASPMSASMWATASGGTTTGKCGRKRRGRSTRCTAR